MATTNRKKKAVKVKTHEGAPAVSNIGNLNQLRRSVMSCMLWEDEFYEDGVSISKRIVEFAEKVKPRDLAEVAIEAREKMHLRHVPLLLLCVLSKTGPELTAATVARVIQRVDEMPELLAILWKDGRKMVPRQMRLGINMALTKFDEYQLAKYDRDNGVKLRDVLRMCRPKPENKKQSKLWLKVKDRTLKTPDTWEVQLSAGKDKKETFETLLREEKLGYMALLRNLRNMEQASVDRDLVIRAIKARKGAGHVLPFRFVTAARHAPQYDAALDAALVATIKGSPEFDGTTVVLVDRSGSMDSKVSGKSEVSRKDAAGAIASLINGDVRVFAFGHTCKEVAARRGLAGIAALEAADVGHATYIAEAIKYANSKVGKYDRMIVITDEQSHDTVKHPPCEKAYVINVASYRNGVGYGQWTHIDGFSESTLRYIHELEQH